jgi:membrane-associated phospholipid phosphatase
MRSADAIAFSYFAFLIFAAAVARVPASRRLQVVATATLMLAVIAAPWVRPHPAADAARAWMPLLYIVVGYWLPAHLVTATDVALEQTLLRFDRRLFGHDGLAAFVRRGPRLVVEYLELAYLVCYLVPPAGFAWLAASGHAAEANRFWTAVLLAAFACYGPLPWFPTRAPRAIERPPDTTRSRARQLNVYVLDRVSVQLNTFPSGHTAASFATALAVGSAMPIAGIVLGIIAVSIAIGSVVGRYHYAADAFAGALVALAAFAVSRL